MNKKIFLIAGTEDGRQLAAYLLEHGGFDVTASVVSDYGRKLLETCAGVTINSKPLDASDMQRLLQDGGFDCIVDASHPYAQNVSSNAIAAAQAAQIFYVRYERAEVSFAYDKLYRVDSCEEAANVASRLGKNIFLTTGSHSLKTFVELLKGCNLTVRVLPTAEVLAHCEALGLSPKQIVAMQGAFSVALNVELFKHAETQVLVTKNSGRIGGADTKLEAARLLSLPVVMINRPRLAYPTMAATFDEVLKFLEGIG